MINKVTVEKVKPIGRKSYGSIPHLIGSKRGSGDRGVSEHVSNMMTFKKRGKQDRVIVTEKLDGSNHSIAKKDGRLIPLQRSGYDAWTSPYAQSHMFAQYLADHEDRFDAMLDEGMRVCGEWMAMSHGSIYTLTHDPFVPFDFMTEDFRVPFSEYSARLDQYGWDTLVRPHVLSDGPPYSIVQVEEMLGPHGFHGCEEEAEGCVWRLETHGKFNIIAKYVRPSKITGKYMPHISGKELVWNRLLPEHQHYIDDYSGVGS